MNDERNASAESVVVRIATVDDVDVIAHFNIAMARETESKGLDENTVAAGVRALFDRPQLGFYVVAEISGRVVGSLMITTEWSDWRNGLFWWVQSVYVDSSCRRRGVYRAMYTFIQGQAQSQTDVCGFRLYVEKDNKIAQRTYRDLGMLLTDYRMFEQIKPPDAD